MIDFRYLEKSQINEYKQYYDYSAALGCEFNFVSAYLWSKEYDLKVAVIDGTLIKAYFRENGTVWGYCMPSGRNVTGALEAVFADAEERGGRACFGYLSQRERDALESLCPGRIDFERSETTQDYIYFSEDLAKLAGKKYHAKRNHISKFYRAYPDAYVRDLTPENRGDALAVVERWCAENAVRHIDHAEYGVIAEALDGSEISPLCFDVNFEKALKAYEGSYAVINNEFAKRLTAYRYINREEDLGLEGLRKAKLSYHPAIIYDRYNGAARW